MKTKLLLLLLSLASCEKEAPPIAFTPPPTVAPLTVKIFSVRIHETISEPFWDSFDTGWFEYYNRTSSGAYASAIDQNRLDIGDDISINAKFLPAYPHDTVYAYIRSWITLADTLPVTFIDTVVVTSNEFTYTYIYN